MSLFKNLKNSLFGRKEVEDEVPEFDPELFVYVKIPGDVPPVERSTQFEDPLGETLNRTGVGMISGGGSQLGETRADGTRPILFCGIDVDVTSLPEALDVLRRELSALDAPSGTELQYTQNGTRLSDILAAGKWQLAQPRTDLHPGFDC
jgi:hypothetical protein